jgi:hypothetical protein
MKRRRKRETFVCPHCGADVAVDATFCRECGSDDETGWAEDADVWAAGIPAGYGSEDDFDYDEFIERELPHKSTPAPEKLARQWGWRVFVVITGIGLVLYLLSR